MTFLYWLLPLWALLVLAKRRGAITLQTVAGVGWQCSVRPPTDRIAKHGAINSWIGQGRSLRAAVRESLLLARENEKILFEGDPRHQPKLGGAEFDPE